MTPPPSRRPDHPRSRGVYHSPAILACAAGGSSPLARGLRNASDRHIFPHRIIPARAGFTFAPRPTGFQWADHPRSRGVYARSLLASSSVTGSSPLARGLRNVSDRRIFPRRIIPARAGFTTRPEFWQGGGLGSSPLARGLQPEDGRGGLLGRIIPARAGFTFFMPSSPSRMPDHPRSRGVYMGTPMVARRQPGSSPLARGLPPLHGSGPDRHRIIPARAGFTRRGRHPAEGDADHPRSRGVYDSEFFTIASRAGSSPLAWGLPRV